MDETTNQLIGDLYDAATDPERWTEVLDHIREHLGFHLAILGLYRFTHPDPVIQVSTNVPDAYLRSLRDYHAEIAELWGGAASVAGLPLDEPLVNSEVVPFALYAHNRFVVDWAKPQGLVDQVVVFLAREEGLMATLSFGRHENDPPVGERQLDVLRTLAPHVRRAFFIGGLLESANARAQTFESALSTIDSGAVLVDEDVRIRYANASALDMLRGADPIRSVHGRLQLVAPVIPDRLEHVIRMTGSDRGQNNRQGVVVPAMRRNGTPVAVHVLPLARRYESGTGPDLIVTAAVFVTEKRRPVATVEALGAVYELTRTERRVYELLAEGCSTAKIAGELVVAQSTVKTHILRLFEKTGQHTRSDLVRLVAETAGP